MIMVPQEEEFKTDAATHLDIYLRGTDMTAQQRTSLFRLIWELGAGSFGGRQTQFERFFFGNSITVSNRLYSTYSGVDTYRQLVSHFLADTHR
ncbi:4-hydroxyphenylacetate 3-monooxygenase oxygenase component [compost metagenome]